MFGGVALACVALACAWSVYADFSAPNAVPVVAVRPTPPADPAEPVDPYLYAALFDFDFSLGFSPGTLSESAPLASEFQSAALAPSQSETPMTRNALRQPRPAVRQLVQSTPLPKPRPAELRAPPTTNLSLHKRALGNKIASAPPVEEPTIFQRLFGKPQNSESTLAYAAPDGGVSGDGQSMTPGRLPASDGLTAVYDISAHTVYMPDGTKLEAHSGLGSRLDDPRHVREKMRGPTPPHVYDLTMREQLFHGVQALRLIPVGGENPFGRTGLLAHSYMLGPNGDSNGCVSFRDYNVFLHAYMNHRVKRLVVVARVN